MHVRIDFFPQFEEILKPHSLTREDTGKDYDPFLHEFLITLPRENNGTIEIGVCYSGSRWVLPSESELTS
jgi:hypothetical protein